MGRWRIKKNGRTRTLGVKESRQLSGILEQQKARFKEQFGREPGPNDPVFFDEDSPTPKKFNDKKLMASLRHAAKTAGVEVAGLSDDELWDTLMRSLRKMDASEDEV